jgi:Salmonella virulence plasmid 28.1kDa A protein
MRDKPKTDTPSEFEYLVRGQVLYRHGLPIPNRRVVAVHRNLRDDIELGRARTDASGNYEIYYNVDHVPGRSPDLQTRVYASNGKDVLGQSAIRFSAGRITKLRIQVDGGLKRIWSEYDQLAAEAEPALQGADLASLSDADAELLAGKTAQPLERVASLIVAHKLGARTGLDPAIFYGLARGNVPTNLSTLLASGESARSAALESATRDRIVPGRLSAKLDAVEKEMRKATVDWSADPTASPLGGMLAQVVDDAGARTQFLERYANHSGPPEDFWASLRKVPALAPKIPALQLTIQLAALTGGHAPLVREMTSERQSIQHLGQLAALSEKDWVALLQKQQLAQGEQRVPASVPGKNLTQRTRLYAQTLRRIVADAMPTETLAFAMAGSDSAPSDVRRFWQNVTASIEQGKSDFELGALDIPAYLKSNPALLEGVQDEAAVSGHLANTQRIFNLTTDPVEIEALVGAGLTSSARIVQLGVGAFKQRFGKQLGQQRSMLVYNKAEHVTAAMAAVLSRIDPQFNQSQPAVVDAAAVVDVPSLATLFGSYDTCTCSECRAVDGPAAYLAEVLEFLRERTVTNQTALDVLFERRPDLGELELTCDNTQTVLPYIDLVNEILERAVSPWKPFTLPDARAAELDARNVTSDLRNAFAAAGSALTDAHYVVVVQAWIADQFRRVTSLETRTLEDAERRFLSAHLLGQEEVASFLRGTNPRDRFDALALLLGVDIVRSFYTHTTQVERDA